MSTLHRPLGSLTDGVDPVGLDPDDAGWAWTGLRVLRLEPGVERSMATGEFEMCVLPLSGSVLVTAGGHRMELEGRASVFARVTDFAYVGRDTDLCLLSAEGGEFALPMAKATRRLEPRYGPVDGVSVEVRGAGPATRQVTNFMTPDTWDHADKLMCCELLTPDGNWSSYPPHKHDESPECEVNNEEIYYFRIGRAGSVDYTDDGFGMHRTYTADGTIDENVVVHDGDTFLVPRGYHGPCIAAPGYTMYYLNVLAGPGGHRSMAFCDDPTHHWVRDEWEGMALDPRCPLTSARGVVRGEAR
ncbi:MAG: 5-deoxy-glucuronate isomerase [Actinomycetia bacterium]|nr:5-deoxy-glucuronate isomerase [Actinomycetes bacterium]MCP3911719.1 5-deoxy-glucuronate isomerase [Actinomycetes bacterium]